MSEFVEIPANKKSFLNRKLMYGLGINDSSYRVYCVIGYKQITCRYYKTWCSMLQRCYSASFQERHPSYRGCSVIDEWFRFSNFKAWMEKQDWKGKQLDKDILEPGNKVYSPLMCVFVSRALNGLLNNHRAGRGSFPQGVSHYKQWGRFQAQCMVDGVQKYLGCFTTADEAAKAYNKFKTKLIRQVASLQTDIRIRNGLLRHAELRCSA